MNRIVILGHFRHRTGDRQTVYRRRLAGRGRRSPHGKPRSTSGSGAGPGKNTFDRHHGPGSGRAAAAVDCRSGRLRPAAALRGHRLQQPAARRRTGNRNGGNQYRRVHAHHGHGFRLFPQAGRRTSGSDQFDRRDQRPRRSGGLLRQQTLPEHLSRRIGTTLTDATARHPHHRHPARIRGHTPAARREIPDADAPRKSRRTNRPGAGTTETAHRHRPPLRRAGIFLEADSRMALGAAADPHEIRPVSKISPDTPCSRHSYPPLKFPQ